MKYTYKDIIIDPRDPRLEGAIGKEVYCDDTPFDVLKGANRNKGAGSLSKIDTEQVDAYPFSVDIGDDEIVYCCIIIKKEPKVKYVPFDLSKEEDRDALRGKWYKNKYDKSESKITSFAIRDDEWLADGESGEGLFKHYTFLDGTPVGKRVEE